MFTAPLEHVCRRVDLSHNAIGSTGEWQLPPSMGTLFSLEWLNLSHNKWVRASAGLGGLPTTVHPEFRSLLQVERLVLPAFSGGATVVLERVPQPTLSSSPVRYHVCLVLFARWDHEPDARCLLLAQIPVQTHKPTCSPCQQQPPP